MTGFKNKSDFNKLAADELIKMGYHSPSVHCSYYSCIQYVLHILVTRGGIEEKNLRSKTSQEKGGSHNFYINTISEHIKKNHRTEAKELKNTLGKLKIIRERSDYTSLEITDIASNDACMKRDEILRTLQQKC